MSCHPGLFCRHFRAVPCALCSASSDPPEHGGWVSHLPFHPLPASTCRLSLLPTSPSPHRSCLVQDSGRRCPQGSLYDPLALTCCPPNRLAGLSRRHRSCSDRKPAAGSGETCQSGGWKSDDTCPALQTSAKPFGGAVSMVPSGTRARPSTPCFQGDQRGRASVKLSLPPCPTPPASWTDLLMKPPAPSSTALGVFSRATPSADGKLPGPGAVSLFGSCVEKRADTQHTFAVFYCGCGMSE